LTVLTDLSPRAKEIARIALRTIPLDLWQRLLPKDVIGLYYHVVSDESLDHMRLYPYKSAAQFENDIAFVHRRAVSYAQVAEHRLGQNSLPPNSVMITFDDGFAECYDVVRPILLRMGVDATFFVSTDFVDEKVPFFECALSLCVTAIERMTFVQAETMVAAAGISSDSLRLSLTRQARAPSRLHKWTALANLPPEKQLLLTWVLGFSADDGAEIEKACNLLCVDPLAYSSRRPIFMSSTQVRQLVSDGFTVGAHGLNHRHLEGCSATEIEYEIVASCAKIRDITGQPRVPFAFPYGGGRIDRRIIGDIVSRHADLVDLIFDSGRLRRDPGFIVNRVSADEPPIGCKTNLPCALQNAWSTPTAWWLSSGTQ
jgi:peptidoglycan/xylan/chitin deacetylase (PgdA/CDA1 family)